MFEPIVAAVFDPAWNAEHRLTIWCCLVAVLFVAGFGLPLPEDVPLTMAGFTTYKAAGDQFVFARFVLAYCIVVVPILLGDLVAYGMGRRFGFALKDRVPMVRRALSDARLARVERWFGRYGSFTVFLGRQVAGVRFVTFYTAGVMRMNVGKFLFWDFLGCLVSVPVWLTLGGFTARYGREWLAAASSTVGMVFLGVVGALAVGLFLFARRRRESGEVHET